MNLDEAVDLLLEAEDEEVASFTRLTDVVLDLRKAIEMLHKVDVADDVALKKSIEKACNDS